METDILDDVSVLDGMKVVEAWIPTPGAFIEAVAAGPTDTDFDGVPNAMDDCWASPSEVRNLSLRHDRGSGATTLEWHLPDELGGPPAGVRYDVIDTADPTDFVNAACLESDDGSDRRATDDSAPSPGTVRYYDVRAENACPSPQNQGPLGRDSNGDTREGRDCS
jgi:hypothetical protein